jgi:hypothetical protein
MEVAVSRWKQNLLLWFQLRKRVVAMAAAELIKGSSGGTLCQSYLQCYCGVAALATPLWSLSFWLEGRRCSLAVAAEASGGLQLAAAADWPLLGTGPVRVVPMLALTALQAGKGLRLEILPSCVIRSARANGGPW